LAFTGKKYFRILSLGLGLGLGLACLWPWPWLTVLGLGLDTSGLVNIPGCTLEKQNAAMVKDKRNTGKKWNPPATEH